MRIKAINKSMMRNFGSAVMNMALLASPFSSGAATNAYYASRKANYGRNNSYLIDDGLNNLNSASWKDKIKAKKDNTKIVKEWSVEDLVLNRSVAIRELVVVDSHIHNTELFSKLIKPGVELVRIETNSNGFDDLMNMLGDYQELNAVHLFAHSQSGQVLLGNQLVNQNTIKQSVQSYSNYNQTIQEGGELLIYNAQLGNEALDSESLEIIKNVQPIAKGAESVFEVKDLSISKGDINATPATESIARKDMSSMFAFSGTIDMSSVKTSGSYNSSDDGIDAEFYTSASKEYTLVVDGANKGTGSAFGRAYAALGETQVTLKFSNDETFNVSSIFINDAQGDGLDVDVEIYSDKGTIVASHTVSDGFSNGSSVALSGSNATGISSLTVNRTGGSTNPWFGFDDLVVASVASANTAPTAIALTPNSVGQSTTGTNSTIGTLSSTDAEDVAFTYTEVAGTGDDDNGSFNISGSTLRADGALAAGVYSLRINTNDGTDDFAQAISVTITDDVAPTFSAGPATSSVIDVGFTVTSTINETGDIYFVVVEDGDGAPTAAQVIAGQNSSGASALKSGSATGTTTLSQAVTGLERFTDYDVYVVARDDEGTPNVQATATLVGVKTTDTQLPSVVLVGLYSGNPTKDANFFVTIDFSEDISGLAIADFSTSNLSLSSLNASDDSTYTVIASPDADGAFSLQLPSSKVLDQASNNNNASNTISATYDGTAPSVVVSTTSSDPTNDNPIPVTITFSEEVDKFNSENLISVSGGTTGDFASADSTVFTVNVTPSGDGTIQVSVGAATTTDLAGNSNSVSNTLSLDYDGTAKQASVNDPSVTEGDGGTATLTFTVTLSDGAASSGASIDFATSNGTATAGSDYTATSGTLNFSSGETSKTVEVTVNEDAVVEADETIILTLSNPSGLNVSIADATGTGTITNDDAATVTLTDVTPNENDGTVDVTFTLDAAVDGGFSVDVSTADNTATTADGDYTAVTAQTINFAGTASEQETVTVTLGGDTKVEADEIVDISMSGLSVATVASGDIDITDTGTITITNDDAATVTIANVSGNEDDGAVTVTVTLDNAVDGGFDVDVSTSDGTATTADSDYGSVSSQTLTFAGSASESETFTITPTADATTESDETVTISMSGLSPATVASGDINITDGATLTILNDDDLSFSLNDPSVSEGASGSTTLQFTVSLSAAAPAGGATVDYATSDGTATAGTDYTATSSTLSFSAGETSKTIDVTVSGDATVENDETLTVTLSNPTGTSVIIGDATGTGTITNDDVAGFTVTESAGSTATTEAGGTDTYTVVLDAEPTSNVVIDVASDDTGEAQVDKATLTFTTANWDTPQTVTVTGQDDALIDGTQTATITMSIDAASTDDDFDGVANETVSVDNTDDDVAGFTVTESAGSTATTEAGGTDTYTVVLDAEPNSNVVIDVASDDTGEVQVDQSSLTFTTANWDTPQTVTATGQDDDIIDGTQTATITMSIDAASTDDNFDGVANETVSVDNTDNDVAGFTVTESAGTTATTEAGGTDTYTVVLDAEPNSNVVIDVASDDTGEAQVDQSSLTFTTANWDTPQTVTATGQDDALIDGTQTATITMSIDAASTDDDFDGVANESVSVDNTDNDVAGFTVAESGGTTATTEAGGTDTYTVVLDAEPNSNVVIDVASDDTGEVTVSASSLTFTTDNWDTPQTVTVTGQDDALIDGTQTATITMSIDAASSDDNFDGVADETVSVDNTDDDIDDPLLISPVSVQTVNAATQTISGTHNENGVTVHAYADSNNDGVADNTTSLGSSVVASGNWSFSVPLTADAANNFVVTAIDSDNNESNAIDVPTITEDSTNPILSSSSPADDAIGFSTTGDISVTFSENIASGTGNITVRDVTGVSDFEVFDITSATATASPTAGALGILNDKLYINPTNPLSELNQYSVRIDATALDDATGNSFAGITDDVTLNFTTADITAPVFENSTPKSEGFLLSLDIDEAGEVYYVVLADGATAPTAAEVKAGTGSGGAAALTSGNRTLSSGDFNYIFSLLGLSTGTSYDIYAVAEDDESTPNLQASPTKLDADIPTYAIYSLGAGLDTSLPFSPSGTNILIQEFQVGANDILLDKILVELSGAGTAQIKASIRDNFDPSLGNTIEDLGSQSVTIDGNTSVATLVSSTNSKLSANTTYYVHIEIISITSGSFSIKQAIGTQTTGTLGTFGTVQAYLNTTGGLQAQNDVRYMMAVEASLDTTPPTITSLGLNNNNEYVEIFTSEGVYNSNSGSGAVEISDIDISLAGGTATSPVITSLKQNDGTSDLVGGENIIRVNFTTTGVADGSETVTINFIDGTSVFDFEGNAALASQSNNTRTLNDLVKPNVTAVSLAADNSYIDVTFNEGVYNDNCTGGALEIADFDLKITNGSASLNAITSVTLTDGNPASGGETQLRVNFTLTGTPDGSETIEVDLQANEVFDVSALVADADQSGNNTATLNDQSSPTLNITSPADDATDVGITDNITLTFSENIQLGSGSVLLIDLDGSSTVETFDVGIGSGDNSGFIIASGNVLTINPGSDLGLNTNYAVQVAATAIDDSAGNSYAGINDNTTFNFTTINTSVAFSSTSSNGAESTGSANLEVSLNAISGVNVTVDYAITGTATGSGTDYTLADGTLTINSGSLTNNISIASIVDDVLDENDETVIVTLSNATNAGLGTNTQHTYTINDNDPTPTVAFNQTTSNGAESTASANLQVDLSAISGKTATVDYAVTGTAAGSGTDYTLANGTLTFTAGSSLENITIASIVGDVLDEADETVIVTLSNPTNATLGTNTVHTYTILDDDATPTVSFNSTSSNGAETTTSANLQVDLSAISGQNVTVDYTVTGTATGSGTDYTLADGQLTFTAGSSLENITIASIIGDVLDENDETVIVTLSNPVNATLGTNTQHTYTILDDDASPTISFTSTSSNGAESVSSANLEVALSAVSGRDASVNYTITGTATGSGTDYTLANGTLTISESNSNDNITIAGIVDDAILEANETVIVTLSNPTNAILGTNTVHTYTINNNDAAVVTMADVSELESGTFTINFSVDNAVEGGFSILLSSDPFGNTTSGDDFSNLATPATINFTGTAGEVQAFAVGVLNDDILEADEVLGLSMSSATPVNSNIAAASIDVTDRASLTIRNDDNAAITIADVSGSEDGGDLTFTATLDNAVEGGFTVDVSTSDGTATATDGDYIPAVSQTVTFAGTAGEAQVFTISPITDTKVESDETFSVSMGNLQATSLSVDISDVATGTITNDDAATIAIDDVTKAENADAAATTTYTFRTTLTGDVDQALTVDYSTQDGTATAAGSDYTASSGTLNFAGTNGEGQTIVVVVANDDVVEADEVFTVLLSNLQAGGKSVSIVDATGVGTITNDDAATLEINDVQRDENRGGATTDLVFTVSLDRAVDGAFTVDYGTGDNTATTADGDYTAVSGQLTFAGTANETQTITVTVTDDSKVELDETFGVQLSNVQASGKDVTITDAEGVGTIRNNDTHFLVITDVSGNEDDGAITVTVSNDKETVSGFDITVQTNNGTALDADGGDYTAVTETLTFAGTAGETQTFTVTPVADQILEANETLTISITGTTSTLSNNIGDTGTVTITNDDAATLSIVDVTKAEGNDGNTAYVFDVTLTGAVDQQVTVDYTTSDGTATTADSDYTAASGTLTFGGTDGEVEQITVNVTGDTKEEADENFIVTLSNIVDGSKGVAFAGSDNQARGTITNEDDNTAPTGFTVTWDDVEINAAEAATASFTFAGAEVGTTYNYSVSSTGGGTAVTGTGSIATATDNITPVDVSTLPDGVLTLSVTLTDSFSNESSAVTDVAELDQTAPSLTLVTAISTDSGEASDDFITNDNTLVFSGTAEANSTVEVFIDGTSIGTTTADVDGNWTFDQTSVSQFDGTIDLTAAATDGFGNVGAQGSALPVVVDTDTPGVTLTTASAGLINGAAPVTITFDEAVSNFALADVTVVNGTASNLALVIANQSWTVDVTPTTDGEVTVQVEAAKANDTAGNDNTASNTLTFTYDGTAPVVSSITRADANPTQDQQVDFDVVFSEDVNNVGSADFEIPATGTINGASITSLTRVSASTYTVTVDRGTGEGTFGLNLKDDDTITDDAGNALGGTGLTNGDFTGEVYNTNSSPTDIGLSATAIDENNALSAVIGNLTSTDADAGDTHSYSLVAGTGDDDNASFLAAGDELIALTMFDFETKASYSVRMETDDGKGGTFQKVFTITVNDVNEVATDITLSNSTIDESDSPVIVGTLAAIGDPDTGESFTYTLVQGDGDDNNLLFDINGDVLSTIDATDFEQNTSLFVRVRVTDSGGLTFEKAFVITINNIENEPLREFDKDAADARVKNFFSPNGDGTNDTWIIEDILDNPINEVKVYSQSGKLIFSQRNYENDWDGTFDGEPIPPGTYYYEINIYNGESIIRGFLTIIRN